MSFRLSTITKDHHEAAARLIHRGLVSWYEDRLRQGQRFGGDWEPFLIIPEVYEVLDPGEALAAYDDTTGEMLGVCFVHPRETHHSIGIVVTTPEAGGRGVARTLMVEAIQRAKTVGKPVRLVSSLLNLDSFSLYTRLGFRPGQVFQDLLFVVPESGLAIDAPNGSDRIRPARPDEAPILADFEYQLQKIRREQDFQFFLREDSVGKWRVLVSEDEQGNIDGFLVISLNPAMPMLGPGVFRDDAPAIALVWSALHEVAGKNYVVVAPADRPHLIRTFYAWGARNVELHVAQVVGETIETTGFTFPTFLPESA